MPVINNKIKISEAKATKGMESIKFTLSYGIQSSEEKQRNNSHKIISAIKGSKNLLIDIDSSLIGLPEKERENCVIDFIKYIRSLALEYRYRKSPNAGGQSFMGKLFSMGAKSGDAHKVFTLVPEDAWNNEDFIAALPFYGVRYYLFKEDADTGKVLDDLYNGQLLDFEVFDYFSAIMFDSCSFGQMGIYTESLTMNELKSLLKL
jgi:hypothetical protein